MSGGMTCSSCSTDNAATRRFCKSCGASIGIPCERCAFLNELADRFCGGCGTGIDDDDLATLPSIIEGTLSGIALVAVNGDRPSDESDLPVVKSVPPKYNVARFPGSRKAAPCATTTQAPASAPSSVKRVTQDDLDRLFRAT